MTNERELAAAREMVERYGAEAAEVAKHRAEEFARSGQWREHDGAIRLLTGVEKLLRQRPGRRVAPRAAALDPEVLALQVLAHIAGDERLLERFVGLTGCGADDLKARAAEPAFLGAVLDFLLEDEPAVVAFAAAAGLAPEDVPQARAKLPGARQDW